MSEEEKRAIEKLTNGEKVTIQELMRKMKKEGIERFVVTRPEYIYIILNLIEKLQKENEELRLEEKRRIIGRYGDTEIHKVINKVLADDYISKQKVKDKIEELEKGPLKINENNKYYYETDAYNKIIIQVLQELLDEMS